MKKIVLIFVGLLTVTAWAETPADIELLSAQKAYQAAIKIQIESQEKTVSLQEQLKEAQQNLVRAQNQVTQLQEEFNQADAQRVQSDAALTNAGTRLDAAWQAVHGQ